MTTYSMKTLLASIAIIAPANTAFSEVNIGGWTALEFDNHSGIADGGFYIHGDVLLSYTNNDLTLGVGAQFGQGLGTDFNNEIELEDAGYLLVAYKDFTITYGSMWDSGNIFAEDWLTYSNATDDDTFFRVDWAANENHHLSFSYEVGAGAGNGSIGYRGRFENVGSLPEVIVIAAVDFDDDNGGIDLDEGAFSVTVPYNEWAYQIIYHTEGLNGAADEDIDYGFAVWRDFDKLTLGAAVEFDEDPSTTINYGFAAQYRLNDQVTFRGEYTREVDTTGFEFGVKYDFGKPQPAAGVRMHRKEYQRWYSDF